MTDAVALANPLREGLRLERTPEPCVFILFGATGDLAGRFLLPALARLQASGHIPEDFRVVGAAQSVGELAAAERAGPARSRRLTANS